LSQLLDHTPGEAEDGHRILDYNALGLFFLSPHTHRRLGGLDVLGIRHLQTSTHCSLEQQSLTFRCG
jgi:hypothetical protein